MSDLNSILKNLDWNTKRPFGWSTSPDSDWRVIFIGTVLLMVLASFLNIAIFLRVERGKFFASEEPVVEETLTFDTNELKKTLESYENRAAEFKRLTSGSASVVSDPSI
jgi:hypothetical protein